MLKIQSKLLLVALLCGPVYLSAMQETSLQKAAKQKDVKVNLVFVNNSSNELVVLSKGFLGGMQMALQDKQLLPISIPLMPNTDNLTFTVGNRPYRLDIDTTSEKPRIVIRSAQGIVSHVDFGTPQIKLVIYGKDRVELSPYVPYA
jgi:hypothetical protein